MTEVFAWLALLILLVLIELATMGLTTIWFAAGALVATIAAACGAPVLVQVILFLVVSVLMLVFYKTRFHGAISMLEGRRPMWTACLGNAVS